MTAGTEGPTMIARSEGPITTGQEEPLCAHSVWRRVMCAQGHTKALGPFQRSCLPQSTLNYKERWGPGSGFL